MFLSGLLLFGGGLLAFSLSAVCGGGAGLLLLPILGSLLPGAQVPAALSIGTVSSSISRIVAFWSRIRWDVVVWFVPPALPAVWLGAQLLTSINPLYLELLMGLFLMANLPLIFRSSKELDEINPLPKGYLALIGLSAGFVSGLTGAVGLLFNRFYLRYGMTKEEIVATRAANEVMLHLVKLILYASFGLLTGQALTLGAVIAVAAMLSSWGMKWVLPRLSENFFRRVGYTAMVVSGLSLFTEAAGQVVTKSSVAIDYSPLAHGMTTQLQWRNKLFSLEFEYDEGFEFEHTIPFQELPYDKQVEVTKLGQGGDHVVVEEVFEIGQHSYEAYVYRKGKLEKFDL
ncbi:sulfite exporter TauE/SafE family protein [Spirosoma oryzicola]|uniref:sulfite exporter TauE/SafE family protein n=1 Tax=Spirosoma oryzicola TaxID=2898794 RepID=UPI001E440029|nr:sulfite exporter TauE/SafE family protein [Spirosoma oryzicola]UHG94753.1 sulfite exporter TauE/SafE family protein [Spirosoma oryzicola]